MATTLEDAIQTVRVTLDDERNPDNSRKFAALISLNIFKDESTGNRVGVVIGETAKDEFDIAKEITVVLTEVELTDTLAVERAVAGIAAFDLKVRG